VHFGMVCNVMHCTALGQVLRNMLAVMRLLAVAKPAAASAGLDLLLTQRREQGIRVTETPMTQQQVRCEIQHMRTSDSSMTLALQQQASLLAHMTITTLLAACIAMKRPNLYQAVHLQAHVLIVATHLVWSAGAPGGAGRLGLHAEGAAAARHRAAGHLRLRIPLSIGYSHSSTERRPHAACRA
jgi:hypothetical protein